MKNQANNHTAIIVGGYTVGGILYILLSDWLLEALIGDPALVLRIQTFKGLGFIGVTALLLCVVLHRYLGRILASETTSRQQEQLLRQILTNSPMAITVVTLGGDIEFMSEAFTAMFGYRNDDIRTLQDWWPRAYPDPEYRREVIANWDKAVAEAHRSGQPIQPLECSVTSKTGQQLVIEFRYAPLGDRGVALLVDVTGARLNQSKLEAQVHERTRALERSNADLEQFAYAISHDLQEPLRTMISHMQLLQRRCGAVIPVEGQEFLKFAVDAGRRMTAMISGMLALSRVSSRSHEPQPVDANTVMADVKDMLASAIAEHDVRLHVGPLPLVKVDQVQFMQVLQNLISNAIRYRDDAPPEIWVEAERMGMFWQFVVRDNGIGIPISMHEHVFRIFAQASTRERGGAGIGLALCRKIVERHNGKIWLDSIEGECTSVYFTIPAVDDPAGSQ